MKIILNYILSHMGFLLYGSSISFILAALFFGIYGKQNKKRYLIFSLFFFLLSPLSLYVMFNFSPDVQRTPIETACGIYSMKFPSTGSSGKARNTYLFTLDKYGGMTYSDSFNGENVDFSRLKEGQRVCLNISFIVGKERNSKTWVIHSVN